MPEVDGRHYPYTEEGKRQAEIDIRHRQDPKYGSADFSVEPDKLNYDRYSCGRPNNQSVGYDGNLSIHGKMRHTANIHPKPEDASRATPNGMFPTVKKTSMGGRY